MASFGLPAEDTIDAVRTVRALLHGFVDLELRGAGVTGRQWADTPATA